MNKFLAIGIISIILSSCVSTKKYSNYVDTKIKNQKISTTDKDWLTVTSNKKVPSKNIYTQNKKSFIPALLYWGWNSTIECELSAETRINYLKQGIYKVSDSLNLKQKLKGKKIEIKINNSPGKFLYVNKGDVIFFIVGYAISGIESINPKPINLEFEYKIVENGKNLIDKKGYVKNTEKPLINYWKSTKKFTWSYLDQFKKETSRIGKEVIFSILEELDKNEL